MLKVIILKLNLKGVKMKAFFIIISWIFGVILVGLMMIYALDKEIEIQENREKAYQEYIERESLK